MVPSPSSFSRASTSVVSHRPFFAAWATSSGLNAWTWTPGAASCTQWIRSTKVSSVKAGWTPESRQISVTFRPYASRACAWIPSLSWQYAPGSVVLPAKAAEPAEVLADVGHVEVLVPDIGDGIPCPALPHLVGCRSNFPDLPAGGPEETGSLLPGEPVASEHVREKRCTVVMVPLSLLRLLPGLFLLPAILAALFRSTFTRAEVELVQEHDRDDNDCHFHDVEREVPDKGDGKQRLADNPLLFDRLGSADSLVGNELVRGRVIVAPRDIPVMGRGYNSARSWMPRISVSGVEVVA